MSDITVLQQSLAGLELEGTSGTYGSGDEMTSPSVSVSPPKSYDETFPSLPNAGSSSSSPTPAEQRPRIGSSKVTTLFHIPCDEKKEDPDAFGGNQGDICGKIMTLTNTNIELSRAKDDSLTFLVYGTVQGVKEARKLIQQRYQQQTSRVINVPKEYHRFLLGKQGKNLQKLELDTGTKITFPPAHENKNTITVAGTREGIDRAIHEIRLRSDELSKQASVKLDIPQPYHPFILGPHGERINKIQTETGVRINVPPSSMKKDEISISGDKDAVNTIADKLRKEASEMMRKFTSVSVEVKKAQHKYVIGPKWNTIAEILEKTGVSVEMPPTDSSSETITLRGPQDKLGQALSMVYEKANSVVRSEVPAPSWMHRYIIGKKGATIQQLIQDYSKVHVEFANDNIVLEGAPSEVDSVNEVLTQHVDSLKRTMKMREIQVDPAYHGHIIGRQGARVAKLKADSNVSINVPEKDSNLIRLEGPPEEVDRVAQEILDSVERLKNEIDMPVHIDHRFHGMVIGTKGENIKEIRERFNNVIISFPEPNSRSNIIHVRGSKTDVQACVRHLKQLGEEIAEKNYLATVPVFEGFNELIGDRRHVLKQIREELQVRVTLPSRGGDNAVALSGVRSNVIKAVDIINQVQEELGSIMTEDVIIPQKFHDQLIGRGSAVVRSIEKDCGGVHIRFPAPNVKSDKVTIRGPKQDVQKAKKMLLEMWHDREERSYTEEVRAKPQHHRYLIGKGGATINRLKEQTNARFIFPDNGSEDKETIYIIGKKADVLKAKSELESHIRELEAVTELSMCVHPKHHRHFVARRGEVLREIAEQFGGVTVSFPRIDEESDVVTLKGSKECVSQAKHRIEEIVANLDATVTLSVSIPSKYHAGLMGYGGSRIKQVTADHDVMVKFPDKRSAVAYGPGGEDIPVANGDSEGQDLIRITGRTENCERAKQALLDLVPVTETVVVPYELHRFIIGQKGKDVRELMEKYGANISIPQANLNSDKVTITGTKHDVERAKVGLMERVKQLEDEKQDRALRAFQLKVNVPARFHPKLIGRRGATVSGLREKYGVNIQIPGKDDEDPDMITVIGYEDKANAAKQEIEAMVSHLEALTEKTVHIDPRVHPRIIGARGRGIRSIMDQFKVDVRFPRGDEDPSEVVVMGEPNAVEDCIDQLLNLEEEFLQDVIDDENIRQFVSPPSRAQVSNNRNDDQRGFVVTGAPWEAGSTGDFPSLGEEPAAPTSVPVWGPRRH